MQIRNHRKTLLLSHPIKMKTENECDTMNRNTKPHIAHSIFWYCFIIIIFHTEMWKSSFIWNDFILFWLLPWYMCGFLSLMFSHMFKFLTDFRFLFSCWVFLHLCDGINLRESFYKVILFIWWCDICDLFIEPAILYRIWSDKHINNSLSFTFSLKFKSNFFFLFRFFILSMLIIQLQWIPLFICSLSIGFPKNRKKNYT